VGEERASSLNNSMTGKLRSWRTQSLPDSLTAHFHAVGDVLVGHAQRFQFFDFLGKLLVNRHYFVDGDFDCRREKGLGSNW